jgi:hypothetical protein
VETLVRLLKHKIRPENAYFKAHDFDFILSAPKEELHQFFIGLYGSHLLPATMHEIEKLLRDPDTIKGFNKDKQPQYIISKKMLKVVWKGCEIVWHQWTQAPVQSRSQTIMQRIFTTCISTNTMKSI